MGGIFLEGLLLMEFFRFLITREMDSDMFRMSDDKEDLEYRAGSFVDDREINSLSSCQRIRNYQDTEHEAQYDVPKKVGCK
jgi:hypothetical protein